MILNGLTSPQPCAFDTQHSLVGPLIVFSRRLCADRSDRRDETVPHVGERCAIANQAGDVSQSLAMPGHDCVHESLG